MWTLRCGEAPSCPPRVVDRGEDVGVRDRGRTTPGRPAPRPAGRTGSRARARRATSACRFRPACEGECMRQSTACGGRIRRPRSFLAGRGVARYTRGSRGRCASRHPPTAGTPSSRARRRSRPPDPGIVLHRDRAPQRLLFASAALAGRPRLDAAPPDRRRRVAPCARARGRVAGVPYVLTVHDLSFERAARRLHRLRAPLAPARAAPALGERAARIVCDTEAVAAEVRRALAVDPGRVRVVDAGRRPARRGVEDRPSAGRSRTLPALGGGPGAPQGARGPRRAFGPPARGLDAELVVAGAGGWPARSTGPGVHLLGAVDDDVLRALYARRARRS